MAPFLVLHPMLLNNWMMVREEASARVRAQQNAADQAVDGFRSALDAAINNAAVQDLRTGLALLSAHVAKGWDTRAEYPWDALYRWAQHALPIEGQEALLSLMLEPHGALVDGLAQNLRYG